MSTSEDNSADSPASEDVDHDLIPADDATDGSADEPPVATEPARSRLRSILRWVGIVLAAVLAVVLVLAVWPTSTGGLGAEPDPTATYDDAVDRFEALTAGEPATVFGPCESVLLDQGERSDVAVVLFHGLTNCPQQFVDFADELHAGGANVVVLRAPHHGIATADGGAIGDLSNVDGLTAGELADYADDAIDIAVGLGDDVHVLGLSMGGVLSNWVAQERADVDRVVAVAPAMSIPGVPRFLTTGFVNFFDKIPPIDLPGESNLDHAYVGESTKGLVATFTLSRAVEKSADRRGPGVDDVTVVLNPDDNQVDFDYVEGFVRSWGDDGDVSLVELPVRGLPHDVIDPDQPAGDVDAVYPFLLELLDSGS